MAKLQQRQLAISNGDYPTSTSHSRPGKQFHQSILSTMIAVAFPKLPNCTEGVLSGTHIPPVTATCTVGARGSHLETVAIQTHTHNPIRSD